MLSLVPSHHNHAIGERIGVKLGVDHVIAFAGSNPNVSIMGSDPDSSVRLDR